MDNTEYELHIKQVADLMYAEDLVPRPADFYIPAARIAVRLQAESFKRGINCGKVADVWEDNKRLTTEEMMIARGLIDPTKCQSCDTILTIDHTGTYCNNNNCSLFWQTKF